MGRIHNLEITVLAQTPAPFIISYAILEKLLNFSVSVMSSLNWGNSPYEKSESEVTLLWLTLSISSFPVLSDQSLSSHSHTPHTPWKLSKYLLIMKIITKNMFPLMG